MKKLFQKIGIITAGVLLALGFVIMPSLTSAAQDCDSNAVIYCGITSVWHLNDKLAHGTGQVHQGASVLTALYAKYGYTAGYSDGKIVDGTVTKTNKVYVGNTLVASNVYSMGRHKDGGSTQISGINYPLYLRHPQYSFQSNSLPAYVVYNYDGSFRLAIIKSCGNIVPGTIKNKPLPTPKYTLTVVKFNDLNKDGVHEANEPYLPNWTFTVSGRGIVKNVTTGANGQVTLSDLVAGNYGVKEISQPGWTASTPDAQSANITNSNLTVTFGNYQCVPVVVKHNLTIVKFNDLNKDGVHESNEPYLANWTFNVVGPNFSKTVVTGSNGQVTIGDLVSGNYTAAEVNEPDWTASTASAQTAAITNSDITLTFGNFKEEKKPTCVQLTVVKFNDANGDKVQDNGEVRLNGWQFNVTGPNGFTATIVTTGDGESTISNLLPGVYTVTEVAQDGWNNTTGMTVTHEVTIDPATQQFVFGNEQVTTPVCTGDTCTPTTPTTPSTVTPTPLPASGPGDMFTMLFGSLAASGGTLTYVRSRKNLKKAQLKR